MALALLGAAWDAAHEMAGESVDFIGGRMTLPYDVSRCRGVNINSEQKSEDCLRRARMRAARIVEIHHAARDHRV